MNTVYKLTDADCYTRRGLPGETLWEIGKTSPKLDGTRLCYAGVYHAYESPLIAAFMDPIHGAYGSSARLWRCDGEIVLRDVWLKCGCHELTLVEELPLPTISITARAHAAIKFGLLFNTDPVFVAWAERWLLREDRTAEAAEAARAEAAVWAKAVWAAAAAARAGAAREAWAEAARAAEAAAARAEAASPKMSVAQATAIIQSAIDAESL